MASEVKIHLGYEMGTGEPVSVPLRHMAVTGQTQESGKTTTLEALIARSDGLRAVAFITKRGERSFQHGKRIPPYFRERADWQFVASILEATMRERLKIHRAWIIRASQGAKTLADVQANVREALPKAKGLSQSIYTELEAYLGIVIPQIDRLPQAAAGTFDIGSGLNLMDLTAYTSEMQALVIRSVLEAVYQRLTDVVVIIPEAWEFIPQRRGSPVKLAAEEFIRKGAGLRNYLWLDSQDLAGVDVAIRKSVIVWLLGVQREENEVKRMLAHIPNVPKPKADDVMQLGRGQFFACWQDKVIKVYVQPAWLDEPTAQEVARGETWATHNVEEIQKLQAMQAARDGEDEEMSEQERARYVAEIDRLKAEVAKEEARAEVAEDRARGVATLTQTVDTLQRELRAAGELNKAADQMKLALAQFINLNGVGRLNQAIDKEQLIEEILARLPRNGTIVQVTPPEALRKEFLQKEAARILEFVRSLDERPRDALRLLEGSGEWIGQKALAERLGVPTAGGSWIAFTTKVKELIETGFVEVKEKTGVRGALRAKIANDLVYYQPTEEDLEQTYQHCLATLAT